MRPSAPSLARLTAAVTLVAAALGPPASAAGAAPDPAPRFVVETDCPSAQRVFLERRLAPFASAADVLLGALLSTSPTAPRLGTGPAPPPVRLRVFCDRARYTSFARGHAPRRAGNGGYFDAATRTVVTYRHGNPPQTLLHEVAHALLRDAWGGASPAPPWLDEGLAEYLSSYAVEPSGVRFGAPDAARLATLLDAHERGPWLPVGALVIAPTSAFTGPDMARYYAAAWGLVDLLVASPALRARLPTLVAALRAGQGSAQALDALYGAGAAQDLDRRLREHLASLGAQGVGGAPPVSLSAAPLGEWTEHGDGRWRADPAVSGGGTLTGESPQGWSYLTRTVMPRRALVLTAQVRRDAGSVGVALGSHRARGYAYHTLVDLGPEAVSLLRTASRQSVEPLARAPGAAPAGAWVPLRVEVAGGTVAVWRDGALAFTARLPDASASPRGRPRRPRGPWVSLLGVYVREGRGAFRDLRLEPPALPAPAGWARDSQSVPQVAPPPPPLGRPTPRPAHYHARHHATHHATVRADRRPL